MKYLISMFVIGVCVCAVQAESLAPAKFTRTGHVTDGLDMVKRRVEDKSAVLIDVREQEEWDRGHLDRAVLVPSSLVRAGELPVDLKKSLPMDKPIYCHCKSGGRVLIVSKLLRAEGYDIRPLKAGYEQLLKEGFAKATAGDQDNTADDSE